MSAQVELAGQVTSGRGQATSHLFAFRDELTCFVKKPLCPGTLNVVLNRPVRLRDAAAYVFDNGRRMIWPASLNGMDVWIYRWAAAPLHVAEIISPVHLRERFHYKDGDNIIVSLSDELITAISPVGRLAWGALWIGRRNWSYSSDTYYSKTMHWCMDLGAAQRPPTVEGTFQAGVYILKRIIKRTPVVNTLARRVQSKITGNLDKQGYIFSRLDTDSCATEEERLLLQIRNVLNFTKISNSTYSAQQFPAAYHTIKINGHQVLGQRDPSMRLALVPVDFRDKTISRSWMQSRRNDPPTCKFG